MSLLPQVNAYHSDGKGEYDYFFALANESAKKWSLYPAISTVQIAGEGIEMSPDVLLSTTLSTLLVNGKSYDPASWALYPAVSSINANNNALLSTISVEIDGHYLTAGYQELLLDGIPIATSTTLSQLSSIQDWALYEAISTIDCVGNKIVNCGSIQLDGSIVTTAGNNILVNAVNPVSLWANYQASSNIDVNSKNINNANQLNFITAVPGFTGATINALNSLNFSYATGLVGQAGINNLNNIAWWNPDYPGVPGFYINMYTKQLSYNGGANTAYLATDTKICVPALYTSVAPGIAGGKLEILGGNADVATVNGNPCSASWARYQAIEDVQMNYHQILNAYQIQFAQRGAGPFNLLAINPGGKLTAEGDLIVTSPASADINVNNFGLTNVRDIAFNGAGHLLATNDTGQLTYNGEVITTGAGGDVRNWAQYNANHNVIIPADYSLSINAENTLTFYKDSHLNTNIYHGVAGNVDSPDFISFPTTFQVGTTLNPAREITMTAGAAGFGINSDTEVNIDATLLVNVFSEGVVSIESITDFNLTAALTTFEIGEWNTVALATTMEVASFDVISAGNVAIEGTIATLAFGATTLTTAGLNIASGAVAGEVASWNLVSAGNVTTLGTQIGFTAGTKFETLSAGDTNLVASGNMNIEGNAVRLSSITNTAIYAHGTVDISGVQELNIDTISSNADINITAGRTVYITAGSTYDTNPSVRIQGQKIFLASVTQMSFTGGTITFFPTNTTQQVVVQGSLLATNTLTTPLLAISSIYQYPNGLNNPITVEGALSVIGYDGVSGTIRTNKLYADVAYIGNFNVNNLSTASITTSSITSGYAGITNISSASIFTSSFKSGYAGITNISSASIFTSSVTGSVAEITYISTASVNTSSISADSGDYDNIHTRLVTTSSIIPNATDNAVCIPLLNVSTITGINPGIISAPTTASVYYNLTDKKLFWDLIPFGVSVNSNSAFTLGPAFNEQAFILTGTSPINFTTTGLAGVASGFYITLKNGLSSGVDNDLTIQENGTTVSGPTSGVLYSAQTNANASICYLLWNGTSLSLY